jgi:hypothetical protein
MVKMFKKQRREKTKTHFKAFWGTIIVLCLLLVTPISAQKWFTQVTFDEFNDGSINTTLWNTTITGINSSINEVGNSVTVYVQGTNSAGNASLGSFNLPSPEFLDTITFRTIINSTCVGTDPSLARSYTDINLFGTRIFRRGCTNVQSIAYLNDSIWTIQKNYSSGDNFTFDIYEDSSFISKINYTGNNELKFENWRSVQNVIGLGSTEIFYVNYTYTNSTMEIALVEPIGGAIVFDEAMTPFNVSAQVSLNELTNISLFFNGLFQLSDTWTGINNNTALYTNTPMGLNNWSALVCDSFNNCKFSSIDTFNSVPINEISQTFNATTIETSTEDFVINVQYNNTKYPFISAKLNYDGVITQGANLGTAGNAIFKVSKDIPTINVSSVLNNFSWNVTVTLANGSAQIIKTLDEQQNVSALTINDCTSGGTPIINFTAAYEKNLSIVNPFTIEGTFEFYIGSGSTIKNLTIPQQAVASKAVCVTPSNAQVITTGLVKYSGANNTVNTFVERDYSFDLDVFNNITTDIKLYLLENTAATSFILLVQNQNIIPINDALIFIERFYPGLNEFRTVQVVRTDDNGQTVGFYKVETVDYRHTIYKDSEQLLQTSKQKIFAESTPAQLTFTVGEIITDPIVIFDGIANLVANLSYNEGTKIVSFAYQDLTGNLSLARLLVQNVKFGSTNTIICNETSTSQTAVLVCDVSGETGTFTAQAFISRSPEDLAKAIIFKITDIIDTMGEDGLLLAWIIILVAAMIGIWNPTVGIILVNVVVFLVNIIGLASFGPIYLFSMVAASVVLIILLKT